MKTLQQRWKAIDKWCYNRGIRQVYTFFRGSDPAIEPYYNRIRMVATSGKPVVESDRPWIESMELTVKLCSNRVAA